MNKHEHIRYLLEYENANQSVFTENQINELRDYIISCEEIERKYSTCKVEHAIYKMLYGCMTKDWANDIINYKQLEIDVQRYFELDDSYFALKGKDFQPECNELFELKEKLSKVGEK